jgi:hypothetical protein
MRTILMASVAAASLVLLASASSAAPVSQLTGRNATPLFHPVARHFCGRHCIVREDGSLWCVNIYCGGDFSTAGEHPIAAERTTPKHHGAVSPRKR